MVEGYFKKTIGGLLGKTVGFYLNDNQFIEGTLIDVKNDHLIVKVNEDIFYFPLSQVHALSKNAKDFRVSPQDVNYLDKNNLIDILQELKYNWITINCLSNQSFAGLLSRIGEDHIVLVNNSEQLFVQSSFITDIYKGKYESTEQDSNNNEQEGNSSEENEENSDQLSKETNLTTPIDNTESNINDNSSKEEKKTLDVNQTNEESTIFNDEITANQTDNESTSLFNHQIIINQIDNEPTLFDHEITVNQTDNESSLLDHDVSGDHSDNESSPFDYEVIVNQINNESSIFNHDVSGDQTDTEPSPFDYEAIVNQINNESSTFNHDVSNDQTDTESSHYNLISPNSMDEEEGSNNTEVNEREENVEDEADFYIQPSNPNSVHLTDPASYNPQKKSRNGKMSAQEYFNRLRGLHRINHKEEQNQIEGNSSSIEKESSRIFNSIPKKVEIIHDEETTDFTEDFSLNSLPRRKKKRRKLNLDKATSTQNTTTNVTTFFTSSHKNSSTESTESQNPQKLIETNTKTLEKQPPDYLNTNVDSIAHKGLLEKQYFALMKYAEKMYNKLRDERLNSKSK